MTAARLLRRGLPATALAAVATFGGSVAIASGHGSSKQMSSAQEVTVVATGLANPRGLTVGKDGKIYVAEAGSGGTGPCRQSPEGGPPECLGASGAITAINPKTGAKYAVVSGLPSLAGPDGSSATGPHDVSIRNRRAWFTVGLGGTPDSRTALGADAAGLGWVYRIDKRGRVVKVADLAAYELAANPDSGQPSAEVDSNPYSIDATYGKPIVTDAGGNDLLSVTAGGKVKTLAVFPFGLADAPPFLGLPPGTQIPVQPVPTGVVRGPRGVAHVGQLTGFPFPAGGASVFSVRSHKAPVAIVSGLTNVIDVAFGPDGSLYVLQITSNGLLADPPNPGKLLRIWPDGTTKELAAGQLTAPSGLTVTRHGTVYVSDNGTSGTDGRIVRIGTKH